MSGKEMVIDITGNSNCGSTCRSVYDTYVSGGGILIIAAENGATNRISNIESLIENKMQVGSYTAVVNGNDAYQSFRSGNYAGSTSNLDTLPGVDGYMYSITGGEVVASNSSVYTTYQTWHKWDYGTNGGAVYVTFGYGQFLSTNSYSGNMDSLLTAIATEEGLYGTTPTYSSAPTTEQLNKRTNTRSIQACYNISCGNGIYIQQTGDNLDLDVQQHGDMNIVAGTSTTDTSISDAVVSGDYNTVNITQGTATNNSDDNVLLFGINGDHNSMTVSQGDYSGDTGGHRAIIDITGGYNSIGLTQYNIGFGSGQFADINVAGNSNTISSTQRETDKMLFVDVNGNSNSITTDQKDSGQHFLDITVTNNQTVGVTQQGTGDHAATINMSGYSAGLSLNQNSSTDQTYSINQNCLTSSGCGTTTVNQQ